MPVLSAIISIGIVFGLAYWLWRKTAESKILKIVFWPALMLRLLCGILIGVIYAQGKITGGDTWTFQKAAARLTELGKTDPASYLDILLFTKFSDLDLLKAMRALPSSHIQLDSP